MATLIRARRTKAAAALVAFATIATLVGSTAEAGAQTSNCLVNGSVQTGRTITGTEGPDVIDCRPAGTEGRTIDGLGGDDRLFGSAGGDQLIGGTGNDFLFGGGGPDIVNEESGTNTIFGGPDFDVLFGGTGNDTMFGDSEPDVMFGGRGNDVLIGGEGDDALLGDAGGFFTPVVDDLVTDRLNGSNGFDSCRNGRGDVSTNCETVTSATPDVAE